MKKIEERKKRKDNFQKFFSKERHSNPLRIKRYDVREEVKILFSNINRLDIFSLKDDRVFEKHDRVLKKDGHVF